MERASQADARPTWHLASRDAASTLPTSAEVLEKARAENFPVALRTLPAEKRRALLALYGWARLVDDLGDEGGPSHSDADVEERLERLDEVEHALSGALAEPETAGHPLIVEAARAVRSGHFDRRHLADLVEANRIDQRQRRIGTFGDLLEYCRWSANPVGRAVLEIFDAASADSLAWSDQVTAGLQIVEHLQDVGEDLRLRDRCYLPLVDLERFGVTVDDLRQDRANEALRALVAFEASRARYLLGQATPLVAALRGTAALAVAAFAAGGLAALDAISAANYDTLGVTCRPSKGRTTAHALRLLGARSLRQASWFPQASWARPVQGWPSLDLDPEAKA